MIPLTVPQILQAAHAELMRQYGRHNAPAITAGIHAAMTCHDVRTAALAATFALTEPAHHRFTEPRYWTGWRPNGEKRLSTVVQVYGNAGGREHWPAAMGIDWMTAREMAEAIPPVYSEHIGRQLVDHLRRAAA